MDMHCLVVILPFKINVTLKWFPSQLAHLTEEPQLVVTVQR